MVVEAIVGMVVVAVMVNNSTPNPNCISLHKELWLSLPDSAKSTISQHNCQYQNTALWEQLPSHAKSAIASAQSHNKQHAYNTTAQSQDPTGHSVADTFTCLWKQ